MGSDEVVAEQLAQWDELLDIWMQMPAQTHTTRLELLSMFSVVNQMVDAVGVEPTAGRLRGHLHGVEQIYFL